eukprot:Skav214379  [mRNA]  locus=scaffold4284:80326:84279:- [translate_table: standard]
MSNAVCFDFRLEGEQEGWRISEIQPIEVYSVPWWQDQHGELAAARFELRFDPDRLDVEEAPVRAAAATALAHLKEAGVEAFVEVLGQAKPDAWQTAAALHGLQQCSDELCCPSIDLIVRCLDDPSRRVRLAAANTLRSLGPLCADSIAQRLKAEDPEERELLVTALGCMGAPNALPYTNMLVALLDSKHEGSLYVQIAAAEALSKCGPETGHAAAVALAEFLSRASEEKAKVAAKQALISLKDVAAEVLPGLLSHQNPDIKCAAFDILDSFGDASKVVRQIAACSSDTNETVRRRCVEALLLVEDPTATLHLLPKMMDANVGTDVANLALFAIGKLGSKASSLAALVAKELKSSETEHRRAASWTLGQLGQLPNSAMKAIVAQLRNEKSEEIRSLLIQAIGSQGLAMTRFKHFFDY